MLKSSKAYTLVVRSRNMQYSIDGPKLVLESVNLSVTCFFARSGKMRQYKKMNTCDCA